MATVTESSKYQGMPAEGLRPLNTETFWIHVDDEEDLDVINDVVKYFKLAKGSCLLNAALKLGDHDAGGTPAAAHSLILNAAVDGNAAADHEIIKDSTIGQGGGYAILGAGAADSDLDCIGRRIEADGAFVAVKTTTAAATLQTDNREVFVRIEVGNYPPG